MGGCKGGGRGEGGNLRFERCCNLSTIGFFLMRFSFIFWLAFVFCSRHMIGILQGKGKERMQRNRIPDSGKKDPPQAQSHQYRQVGVPRSFSCKEHDGKNEKK